jgi:predicted DsbA family dithiol-disulfide isomerase
MNRTKLHLDVVLDVVCPWCFLGKRRLDAAIAEVAGEIDVLVAYRPFQLDPAMPKGGMDRGEYLAAKFNDRAELDEVHARLVAMGSDVGIRYDFEAIERTPNTLDAHRLIRWAGRAGQGAAMVERLCSLYFEEGADLGSSEVLSAAAAAVGLDAAEIAEKLGTDLDVEAVEAEVAHASRIGITGVPCVIVDRRFAISGAQPAEVFADALRRMASEIGAVQH